MEIDTNQYPSQLNINERDWDTLKKLEKQVKEDNNQVDLDALLKHHQKQQSAPVREEFPKLRHRNGFTKGSEDRIKRSEEMSRRMKEAWVPSMPREMVKAVENICNTAIGTGHPAQTEFAVGRNADGSDNKVIRLIAIPNELLKRETVDGEIRCTFSVPEYCGEIKKI